MVVRKILQHLGMWETQQRPPPKKIVSSLPPEPMEEDHFSWAADPVYLLRRPGPGLSGLSPFLPPSPLGKSRSESSCRLLFPPSPPQEDPWFTPDGAGIAL